MQRLSDIYGVAQCISICRWLQLVHKDQSAPLEHAPFCTPWARKRSRVAQRFHQYLPDSPGFLRNKNAALPARAQKNPLDPQRPEKIWVPAGASDHELSRPKRVSWLPAYGMMAAMSIPVSCVGVKTHVFMNDLVVDQWASVGECSSHHEYLCSGAFEPRLNI